MRDIKLRRTVVAFCETLCFILTFLSAVSIAAVTASAEGHRTFAAEPNGLWPGPMHGKTPETLRGATVLDSKALASLMNHQRPILIDVSNLQIRPQGQSGVWNPVHLSLPNAIWLPGAGTGKNVPGFANAFANRAAVAVNGDKERPIVVFCHPQQWGSWNAAKRLTLLGYKHVYWFPGGGDGLGAAVTKEAKEDAQWRAAGFDQTSAGDMPDDVSGGSR